MQLKNATWQEVRDFSREAVCLIPTGSLEQHGPHLPLFTDTLLVTAVAEEVHDKVPEKTLLTPTIWLGCSSHHLAMDGSMSASTQTYIQVLTDVIESLRKHRFRKFFVINGHGGNREPNGIALRELKAKYLNDVFAHAGYYELISGGGGDLLKGHLKSIRHACEAEASLMLHLHEHLVRKEKLRDDWLVEIPPVPEGLTYIRHFDEVTEEGSWGFASLADKETGRLLFERSVESAVKAIEHIYTGSHFQSEG